MGKNVHNHLLPNKIDFYLKKLSKMYTQNSEDNFKKIVDNCIVSFEDEAIYDKWNGEIYYHGIILTISKELYFKVYFDNMINICDRLKNDINTVNDISDEYVSCVSIKFEGENRSEWRLQMGVYVPSIISSSRTQDTLRSIWGEGHIRLFLSHKSTFEDKTARLKASFSRCGVAAFVANEDIKPTQEWQQVIISALFSMDALAALLTDDFHSSDWTDQEVGVALGRDVPLIAVRLGKDPYGLMGMKQGLGDCAWNEPDNIAVQVFQLLHRLLPDKARLFDCALSAYRASESYADSAWKVKHLFTMFESLTEDQVNQLIEALQTNVQNYHSFEGNELMLPLLRKWTGNKWVLREKKLTLYDITQDDEVDIEL